nr:MAG TPA: hypothetical protein [Caudoviricetes sp.]
MTCWKGQLPASYLAHRLEIRCNHSRQPLYLQ